MAQLCWKLTANQEKMVEWRQPQGLLTLLAELLRLTSSRFPQVSTVFIQLKLHQHKLWASAERLKAAWIGCCQEALPPHSSVDGKLHLHTGEDPEMIEETKRIRLEDALHTTLVLMEMTASQPRPHRRNRRRGRRDAEEAERGVES